MGEESDQIDEEDALEDLFKLSFIPIINIYHDNILLI